MSEITERELELELMRVNAMVRRRLLYMGLIIGVGSILGGVCASWLGSTPVTSPLTLKVFVGALDVVSVLSAIWAYYTLLIEGGYAGDEEWEYLRRHAVLATVGFMTASYALCILLFMGNAAGYWWFVGTSVVTLVALYLVFQGLDFVREDLGEGAGSQFIV